MTDQLSVYLRGEYIGILQRDPAEASQVTLSFDGAYEGDVSAISEGFMARGGATVSGKHITNFLGGYVPEGPSRTLLADRKGIDEDDLFGLLRGYGLTLAGALSFRTRDAGDNTPGGYRKLTRSDMARKVRAAAATYDQGNEPEFGPR